MQHRPTASISRTRKHATTRALASLLTVLLWLPNIAFAGSSDIELFASGGSVPPNILLLIDNSGSMDRDVNGNWCSGSCDSRREIARDAVRAFVDEVNPVVSGVRQENARLGLMTYRANGASVEVPLGLSTSDTIKTEVGNLSSLGVGTPISGSILDAGRYMAGSHQWGTLPVWGTLSGESTLADPIDLSCRENFIIFVTDGEPRSDEMIRTGYWATVGDADSDNGSGEGDPENDSSDVDNEDIEWGDDVTYAMANRDFRSDLAGTQDITTHMIGFTVDFDMLERMADNGNGEYYIADDADELGDALSEAAGAVFDSLAGFSTAVVPTSRSLSTSTFYNAYFEPSGDAFWEGHLESYGLLANGDIVDQAGNPAIDSSTGLLVEPHNPYWDAAVELRTNTARTLYTTISNAKATFDVSNAAITEAMLGITASDVTAFPNHPASGVTTTAAVRDAVINYVHGKDAFDESGDSSTTDMRSKVFGDIFHSTPRIVAAPSRVHFAEDGYGCDLSDATASCFYKSYRTRDRVIYAGANDGLLHAFDAGDHSTGDDPVTTYTEGASHEYYSVGTGAERFGYVPGLLLDKIEMLPRNSPRTFYYVDGSPIHAEAWLGDGSGNDTTKSEDEWATVMVTGFREGGEGYIALDVTDPDAGALDAHGPYPLLLWEFTDAKLGQAWSEPVITRIKMQGDVSSGDNCGYDDGDGDCREQWVAIFAGGYHQDADPHTANFTADHTHANWTDRSRAIFIVALDSGNVLAQIDHSTHGAMDYALPSSPGVLDLDSDGFADVVYVGDLGGQVWKWDISNPGQDTDSDTKVDNWTAAVWFNSPAVSIGGGESRWRSFFYPPTAAYENNQLSIAFGSGEREDLRYEGDASYDENNRLYVVKDLYPTGPLAFVDESSNPRPVITEADLTNVTSIKTDNDLSDLGYYIIAEDGEKFTSDMIIFAGYLIATTYTPNATSLCAAASGESYLYILRLRDGYGLYDTPSSTAKESRRLLIGEGLASSPRVSLSPDSANDKVFIKTSKSKILPATPPNRSSGGVSVIYWKENY